MSEIQETRKKDDPMDVDALSKGKSKGKGKKGSQPRTMSCACTVASLATTRKTVDKSGGQEAKVDQKQVRKVTNMLMDGIGVVSMLMGCGKRQTGRQELVQDCGREQTIGHHGKNQWG